MICIRCDCETFIVKPDAIIEQDFGGSILSVECPASECEMCGWRTVTNEQADILFKRTVAEHMKKIAQKHDKPEPKINGLYRSKCTGSMARLLRIKPNGVVMKHSTREAEQSWHTFYSYWKPF